VLMKSVDETFYESCVGVVAVDRRQGAAARPRRAHFTCTVVWLKVFGAQTAPFLAKYRAKLTSGTHPT